MLPVQTKRITGRRYLRSDTGPSGGQTTGKASMAAANISLPGLTAGLQVGDEVPVAVDLLFVVGHCDRNPGLPQDLGVGQAFVTQRVIAGHYYVCRW